MINQRDHDIFPTPSFTSHNDSVEEDLERSNIKILEVFIFPSTSQSHITKYVRTCMIESDDYK